MLKYQPEVGSIVICNFRGFQVPEMVKSRPVIIINRHPENKKLVTIIPISSTAPDQVFNYHHLLDLDFTKENLKSDVGWVKCDMVYVVCIERLKYPTDNFFKKKIIIIDSVLLNVLKNKVGIALGIISPSEEPTIAGSLTE